MTNNKNIIEFIGQNRGERSFSNREPESEIKTPEIILKLREHFPDQNFSPPKTLRCKKIFPIAKDFYEKNVQKFTVFSTKNKILNYTKKSNFIFDKETIKKKQVGEVSPFKTCTVCTGTIFVTQLEKIKK